MTLQIISGQPMANGSAAGGGVVKQRVGIKPQPASQQQQSG